ncbi:MAG: hypothetical protein KGN79_05130 [Acidobacteriota bacterium]|nr:hypothetical protein [Acidobacteriota bacterium]
MKFWKREEGNILVLTSLTMMCIFGFVGLANDVGVLYWNKRKIQSAADSAAVAGATELNYVAVDNSSVAAAAKAAAAQNGFTDGQDGVTVTVNNGPSIGPHAGNSHYIEVIVQRQAPTFFLRLFGDNYVTVSARAVAGFGGGQGCIFALSPTGTAISVSGGAAISSDKCQIFDNSSDQNALTVSSNATLTAKQIGVVGGYSESMPGSITPNPVTGIVAATDPLAYLQPPTIPSACAAKLNLNGSGSTTLSPGCYTDISYSGSGNLTFQPGTYIFTGNVNLNGSGDINGSGVTFYVGPSGGINATNGVLNLSAPTSGTYDDILLYQDRANTNNIVFSGQSGSTLEGIFYAPDASLSFTGNATGTQYNISLVANTVSLSGQAVLQNYSLVNGSSPLGAPELVE